jgi:hypothetical protein
MVTVLLTIATSHKIPLCNIGLYPYASFKAFMVVIIFQVEGFWFVTSYSVVVGYHRFRSPC